MAAAGELSGGGVRAGAGGVAAEAAVSADGVGETAAGVTGTRGACAVM